MAEIMHVDRVINVAGRWNPSDVAYVFAWTYNAENDNSPSELIGEFLACPRDSASWPRDDANNYNLIIRFIDVRDLTLRELGGLPTQVMGFSIEDISHKRWENVHFEVEDYEDDKLHFFCREIEVVNACKSVRSG